MKFGYYDDNAREYVITTPRTPLPWINYLGCNDFFSIVSNTCGGYSFYKDAKMLRITRYRYNSVPYDSTGKYYYISDAGTVWNPGWQPTQTELDSYECHHGIGYTRFLSSKNGLHADLLNFVPLTDTCEINCLKLKNESGQVKNFKLYSYVEFCLWNALDDMTNYQRNLSTGEVEVIGSTIYHKTEYRERRNHYSFFSVNEQPAAFDTSRDAFIGTYNPASSPKAVLEGGCTNSVASGWYPIASHQLNVSLEPGAEKTFVFVLGYAENPKDQKWESAGVINKKPALAILNKYRTEEDVEKAFCELNDYWKDLLSRYTVKSGDEKVNRMVNIWNQYQCKVTFNMSRSTSYYESGIGRGMGFRDSCQDLLGFVHLIPEKARERIIDIASTQFADGSAYHQYQPLTKRGNADIGSGFNDDPLWLIAGTSAYIRETGDFSILDEPVPFDNDESTCVPLFEHLTRSFDYIVSHKGPHGLPQIGRADWNDCLNLNCFSDTPGESFQTTGPSEGPVAESVFIAGMFVRYGEEYRKMCLMRGLEEKAAQAESEIKAMYDAALTAGWDGEWFVRAYDANGDKVGSKDCEEGKIFIEPQGFCVLAGIGVEEGKAQKALASVEKYLDTKYGIMILQPSYTRYYLNLGEISSYPPGYKENGGIFCHNNPWVSIAETVVGHGGRAFDIYRKTCPAYIEDISEIHCTEPYVYSQMVAGKDARYFGQGKNSWLTGTAAWTFVNISQFILGIRPEYTGLSVNPCVPKDFGGFTVDRLFRGAVYHITVENPDHVEKGIRELIVDGKKIEGTIVPFEEGKKEYNVTAVMG